MGMGLGLCCCCEFGLAPSFKLHNDTQALARHAVIVRISWAPDSKGNPPKCIQPGGGDIPACALDNVSAFLGMGWISEFLCLFSSKGEEWKWSRDSGLIDDNFKVNVITDAPNIQEENIHISTANIKRIEMGEVGEIEPSRITKRGQFLGRFKGANCCPFAVDVDAVYIPWLFPIDTKPSLTISQANIECGTLGFDQLPYCVANGTMDIVGDDLLFPATPIECGSPNAVDGWKFSPRWFISDRKPSLIDSSCITGSIDGNEWRDIFIQLGWPGIADIEISNLTLGNANIDAIALTGNIIATNLQTSYSLSLANISNSIKSTVSGSWFGGLGTIFFPPECQFNGLFSTS